MKSDIYSQIDSNKTKNICNNGAIFIIFITFIIYVISSFIYQGKCLVYNPVVFVFLAFLHF